MPSSVKVEGSVIQQLKAINTMAQSTSSSVSGRIGMIGDRVVKFNTHWHERMFGAKKDQQMIDSCNKLRTTLAELSYKALDPMNSSDPTRAAALEEILKDLGVAYDNARVLSVNSHRSMLSFQSSFTLR